MPEDAAAIQAVIRAGWIDAYVRAGIVTPEEVAAVFEGHLSWAVSWSARRSAYLGSVVATEADAIVGVVSMGLIDGGGAGEVQSLYVAPDHQARGVGTSLWEFALGAFRHAGVRTGCVWAFAGSPSCRFYEARGGRAATDGQFWLGRRHIAATGFEFEVP